MKWPCCALIVADGNFQDKTKDLVVREPQKETKTDKKRGDSSHKTQDDAQNKGNKIILITRRMCTTGVEESEEQRPSTPYIY